MWKTESREEINKNIYEILSITETHEDVLLQNQF